MMNPEIKAKWVAALRSGEYQQGIGYLRSKDGTFCCLGVLCDVVAPEAWRERPGCAWSHEQDVDREGSLGPAMLVTTGLADAQQAVLYGMNDDQGKTFAEIADYIEEYL